MTARVKGHPRWAAAGPTEAQARELVRAELARQDDYGHDCERCGWPLPRGGAALCERCERA